MKSLKEKSVKICWNKNNILYFFCFFLFFEPQIFHTNFNIHFLISVLRMIIGMFCLIHFIKQKSFPRMGLWIILYYFVLGISMYKNGVSLLEELPSFVSYMCMVLFLEWIMKKNINFLIDNLYILFWGYLIINILIDVNHFGDDDFFGILGGKNAFGPICLMIMLNAVIKIYITEKKRDRICIFIQILFALWECMVLNSSTGIMGIMAYLTVTIVVVNIDDQKKLFKVFYIISWILVYLLIDNKAQGIVAKICEMFGKDMTFQGRTIIWKNAVGYIQRNLFFGYARSNVIGIENYYGITKFWAAHNGVLDLLILGGLPLLMVYELLSIFCAKRGENGGGKAAQFCVAAFFAFRVMLLMEYYEINEYYVLILFYLRYSPKIEKMKKGIL